MVKVLKENNEIKQMPVVCIKNATLLTMGEASNLPPILKQIKGCAIWWTSQESPFTGVYVVSNGVTGPRVTMEPSFEAGVRPALLIDLSRNASDINILDTFEFGGHLFDVVNRNMALCQDIIGICEYNDDEDDNISYEDACLYKYSKAKKMVDEWFQNEKDEAEMHSIGLRSSREIADENDFGF